MKKIILLLLTGIILVSIKAMNQQNPTGNPTNPVQPQFAPKCITTSFVPEIEFFGPNKEVYEELAQSAAGLKFIIEKEQKELKKSFRLKKH